MCKAVVLLLFASNAAWGAQTSVLAGLAREIQAADYRAERARLLNLATRLDTVADPKLRAYREYWKGFALWRRAINGFNETPTPDDLERDLEAAIGSFEAALRARPGWVEARIGIVGCGGPLFFLAKGDDARVAELLEKYRPVAAELHAHLTDNPRALWLQGQTQLGAPPPYGGRPADAAATFHRGVLAALAEARARPAGEPAWVPRWGGAENLMNLAYLYVHSPLANRELALVAAPEWHYLRDILWPQIMALPEPTRAPEKLP
jgi:hypothetical protein